MLPASARDALSTVAAAVHERPDLVDALRARWRGGNRAATTADEGDLPEKLSEAADLLGQALAAETQSTADIDGLGDLLSQPQADVLFAWCEASTWRRDAHLAPLLARAMDAGPPFRERAATVARARIVEGPLLDALRCARLLGHGNDFTRPENVEARARLEILIWEAGASALEVPELGAWLWGSLETFEALVATPAHGALRGRVLAARCIEISARGMAATTSDALVGRTLQVLQPLLLHPEPLVWVHAARALGRLTGAAPQLEGTLLDWIGGRSPVLRLRALTALASLPPSELTFLAASQLVATVGAPNEDPWTLAAIAAASPYLYFSRREVWARLAARILDGEGGAISARGLARGLATLWRRGERDHEIEATLRTLREMARSAHASSLDDARRWIEVIAFTDPLDDAERDPLDLELGLENLVRVAAQYDDEEADARAARFAGTLAPTFLEASRIALGSGRLRQRAAAMNALEGCARALALRLWSPLLATRPPASDLIEEPNLEETWNVLARGAASILDAVTDRRGRGSRDDDDVPLEVLAIRLGGYVLDACGEDVELGPGRGPTAHATCLWLRKIEGLTDGSRVLPASLQRALSALFWRLVDATRGTALGEVDDVHWLGPFAAWWALVIDRPAVLLQLATALPMMAEGSRYRCVEQAEALRTAVLFGAGDGRWGPEAARALGLLHADGTELAQAIAGLASALATCATAAGPRAHLDAQCTDLVVAAARLHEALSDPQHALRAVGEPNAGSPLSAVATENAPRVASLVARAIRARDAIDARRVVWPLSYLPRRDFVRRPSRVGDTP